MSADFVYCDILNTGMIPYINKQGPLFFEHLGIGVYTFLQQNPRVEIYITTKRESDARKQKYLNSLKKPEVTKEEDSINKTVEVPWTYNSADNIPNEMSTNYTWFNPIKDIVEVTNVKAQEETPTKNMEYSSQTKLTDEQLDELTSRLSTIDVTPKPDISVPTEISNPVVDAVEIPARYDYSDEELRKKTRKELTQILINMGHTPGVRGNAHAKANDDKLGPRYQDTRTVLIAKIKKVIAQEHPNTEENKETSEN